MNWWWTYLIVVLFATILATILTYFCRQLSWKLNMLDRPLGEHHKKHRKATPLLGGLGMFLSWILIIFPALWLLQTADQFLPLGIQQQIPGISSVKPLIYVITLGAGSLTIIGLIDDWRPLGPFVKLLLQLIICASVSLYPKIRITVFMENQFLTWFVTVCWFMFIINAINFFDNMDGLASGIALIAAIIFTLVAAFRNQYFVAALGSSTAGCAIGFHLFNRYPASIFMGDSGSHFLGFMLSVIGSLTSFYQPVTTPTVASLLIPFLVLAVPIFDTVMVIFIRACNGKPIHCGDHNHISHRFHQMGIGRKRSVFLVHLLALSIGFGALTLLWLETTGAILILFQTITILVLITVLHQIKIKRE